MVEKVHAALLSHKALAQERTLLASERTTLAWIRTGFGAFALGIALIRLFDVGSGYVAAGYVSLAVGLGCIVLGVVAYPRRKRRILAY